MNHLLAISIFATCAPPVLAETRIEAIPGQSSFTAHYKKASDFSGLTWIKGERYYAVSNQAKAMFPLRIELERGTGAISAVHFDEKISVKHKFDDFEGIAWVPDRERLYISSESHHGIIGYDTEGDAQFAVEVPAVFQNARRNKSLESLTFSAGAMWTANEDTLDGDGPKSSAGQGALVRLQKFDGRFRPAAQFAYRTESSVLRSEGGGTGVTDLCALPNGELLVLERVVSAGLAVKIFRVDFSGATDTSKVASLKETEVTPVKKTLLFERLTLATNYEGVALGPELDGGWRSLILIADNGGGAKHHFMPLRIRWDALPKK
jgi:hypothetical protein